MNECREIKALLTAAGGGKRDVLELRYRENVQEVKYSMHNDKRDPTISLVREANSIYRITEKLDCGGKSSLPAIILFLNKAKGEAKRPSDYTRKAFEAQRYHDSQPQLLPNNQ